MIRVRPTDNVEKILAENPGAEITLDPGIFVRIAFKLDKHAIGGTILEDAHGEPHWATHIVECTIDGEGKFRWCDITFLSKLAKRVSLKLEVGNP